MLQSNFLFVDLKLIRNDEIYNSDNDVHHENIIPKNLSDSDLNKKHKEFLNAIRTENLDLIRHIVGMILFFWFINVIIDTYQKTYDIINRVDPETGQTAIFLAAILNGDEPAYTINIC